MVVTPVVQALGWITDENKILKIRDLSGLKLFASSKGNPTMEYEWCAQPRHSISPFSIAIFILEVVKFFNTIIPMNHTILKTSHTSFPQRGKGYLVIYLKD